VKALIKNYCRESGVRNLQKHIEKIYRKVAYKVVKGTKEKLDISDTNLAGQLSSIDILNQTNENIIEYVGIPVYSTDRYHERTPVGTSLLIYIFLNTFY